MAFEEILGRISLDAGADLSADQYKFADVNSSGQAILCATKGKAVLGVIQNKPDAAGKSTEIGVSGVTKLVAGGIVAAGDMISATAAGLGVKVTGASGDIVLGVALTAAAASGDIFSMAFGPNYAA